MPVCPHPLRQVCLLPATYAKETRFRKRQDELASRERAERCARFNFASSPHSLLLAQSSRQLLLPPLQRLYPLSLSLSLANFGRTSPQVAQNKRTPACTRFLLLQLVQRTPIERLPLASSRVDPLPPFDPPPSRLSSSTLSKLWQLFRLVVSTHTTSSRSSAFSPSRPRPSSLPACHAVSWDAPAPSAFAPALSFVLSSDLPLPLSC